ncbi:MAG: hypothetical protein IPK73_18675 [Candidatus Obscuribacter sp.]|nr:hypothetical protein [Candidatus Obscuribacter sp.]
MKSLAQLYKLNRRYNRSINLERDLSNPNSVEGYVLTPRSSDALERVFACFEAKGSTKAWTLTGAYGTGKSSFAHFLACLCGPIDSEAREIAQKIGKSAFKAKWTLPNCLQEEKGLVRAVATAQREPLEHTVLRALQTGAVSFWSQRRGGRPDVLEEIDNLLAKAHKGKRVDASQVINLVKSTAKAAKTGLLLIIDELGKNLEFASQHSAASDLYLLQQLAELSSSDEKCSVFTLAILHQAFAEYAHGLSTEQRNEWMKVQGRFEDIPFTGSTNEMVRLMAQAIDRSSAKELHKEVVNWSSKWFEAVKPTLATAFGDTSTISTIFPIHPVAAAVLPVLCSKYGQNDRSLFTFLTSDEPNSLPSFLHETTVEQSELKTLKLHRVYDYWIDAAGSSLYSRPQLQRWVEIQGKVADAAHLDQKLLALLKTIGLLNLVSSGGHLRATRSLVEYAMCDTPDDSKELQVWSTAINELIEKRLVVYRSQLDELRIWEGSDFDIEPAIQSILQCEHSSLEEMLTKSMPLSPFVAQRHSYQTGTLRYFERAYLSDEKELLKTKSIDNNADGLIVYWLGSNRPKEVPAHCADEKPLVVIPVADRLPLERACKELWALKKINSEAPELKTDGVARREVRQRLVYAQRHLEDVLFDSFRLDKAPKLWITGQRETICSAAKFSARLSNICDQEFDKAPVLWNELINRRELTSQGAKARRELIEAMLSNQTQPRLGLQGFGPECSMYSSVLENTGIHRQDEFGVFRFMAPTDESMIPVWQAIENYCLESTNSPRPVFDLFQLLSKKPYGLKDGVMPILLAAVLIDKVDDVCIYKDGSFVPILGLEHFELLFKDPNRFSIKHFVNSGLRAQVFKAIEELVRRPDQRGLETRNAKLLGVVKPLVGFAKQLPQYTRKTKSLSQESIAIREALYSTKQPDELLFKTIPEALGLDEIVSYEEENQELTKEFSQRLLKALKEIQLAYDLLLSRCKNQLAEAFGTETNLLREYIGVRAKALAFQAEKSPFESFIKSAIDETIDDKVWLERVLMVIGDKPSTSWTDDDVSLFETGLRDFVRRFNNFESLHADADAPGAGYDARRITLTKPSGQEVHRVVWLDKTKEADVTSLAKQIIDEKLKAHPELQDAIISKLAELILQRETEQPLKLKR